MNRAIPVVLLLSFVAMTGCLKTRDEVKQSEYTGEVQDRMNKLQRDVADRNAEFDQVNAELRLLTGRIEALEAARRDSQETSTAGSAQLASQIENTNRQLRLLEQEVTKLAGVVQHLQQQVQSAQSAGSRGSANSGEDLGNFAGAENDFDRKNWKDAILGYEKYRELNPKGRRFSEATYKIGYSFQQLGMKPEARAFYEEVVAKDPKSTWASQAKARLKKL